MTEHDAPLPPRIHPSAVVGSEVELAPGVEVGPFCLLDGAIRIGTRTRLIGHVTILGEVELGAANVLHPNAVIGELGESGASELCVETLNIFVSAYGAEAGNLALKILAVGGMYVGGGIAPKLVKKMQDGTFMKAFTDKGRLSNLLVQTPVRLILESRAALMGAAAYAEARAAEISGHSERARSVQLATS